jgi:hypothetical protein
MSRSFHLVVPIGITLGLLGCSTDTKAPVVAEPVKQPNEARKENNKGVNPDDPSVVFDEPYTMNTGFKTYNGRAYDKASLWIDPKIKLVLPDEATEVVRHAAPNTVNIYMEKNIQHYYHTDQTTWPILGHRPKMGYAIKLENGTLLIDTFGEFSYIEGANSLRLMVEVPREVEVIRRRGLDASRHPRPALTKKRKGQSEVWLPPEKEDGWHEIPALADLHRRAEKQ